MYQCGGSVDLDKDSELKLTSNITLVIGGSFTAHKSFTTTNNGYTLAFIVGGSVDFKKDVNINADITAGGDIDLKKDSRINGNITVNNGNDLIGQKNVVITGTCTMNGGGRVDADVTCRGGIIYGASLHHVRVTHTTASTNCGGASVTVSACAGTDSSGSCTAYTGGVTGNVTMSTATGASLGSAPFTINSGNSSTSVTLPTIAMAQAATLSFSSLSPTPTATHTCWNGSGTSCVHTITPGSCLHHLRATHNGAATTCNGGSVTIAACTTADSSGACTGYTSGVTGNLTVTGASGTSLGTVAYTIPANSSSTTVTLPATASAQTATLGFSGQSVSGTSTNSCWNSSASSTACTVAYSSSACLHHLRVSHTGSSSTCSGSNVTVTACAGADSGGACTAYTAGITGNVALTNSGAELGKVPFTIAANNSSTTITLPTISASQTGTLGISSQSVANTGSNSNTCWNSGNSPPDTSCAHQVTSCLHHTRLTHSGSGVTCIPAAVTVNLCESADDSNGRCNAYKGNQNGTISGTLNGTVGTVTARADYSITNSDSTVVSLPVVTAGTANLVISSPNMTCWNTVTNSASCQMEFAPSGFSFTIKDHVAETSQAVNITAVQSVPGSSGSAPACSPGLTGGHTIRFSCGYANPSDGTLPVRVGGIAVSSSGSTAAKCDTTGHDVNLNFNSSGVASTTVQYADVGQATLSASYSAKSMSGSSTFIAAPARFTITPSTAAPQADVAFNTTVTAVNNAGAATPNFGKEASPNAYGARLTFSKCGGAATGDFSVNGVKFAQNAAWTSNLTSFTSGSATLQALKYSEVGTLDASAQLISNNTTASNYMVATFPVNGTTNTAASGCSGALGRFRPAWLQTSLTNGTSWAYSGVPMAVTVTAMNGSGVPVKNYTSTGYANPVTLTAVKTDGAAITSGAMAPAPTTVASTSFASGVAQASPTFAFTAVTGGANAVKPSPETIKIRATDAADNITSSGHEASIEMRFGRLRLFNAYGSSLTTLKIPVQAEYWHSKGYWVLNNNDSVTTVLPGSIAITSSGLSNVSAGTSNIVLSGGKGNITLTSTGKGYADVAVNLGATGTTADSSCLSNHPATTANNLAGLRSYHGCGNGYTSDPSARASFGVQAQETKGVVHVREVFN